MESRERPTLLQWQPHQQGARVLVQGECILELTNAAGGDIRFTHAGQPYTLRTTGAWQPRTVILRNGAEVLRPVSTGLFERERIALLDGGEHTVVWTNAPLVKLSIRTAADEEVLSLRLATEGGVHTETVLHGLDPREERAQLLLAYAYHLFGGIMRGEGGGDGLPLVS